MRVRARLKTVGGLLCVFCVVIVVSFLDQSEHPQIQPAKKNERRIASIDAQELEKILQDSQGNRNSARPSKQKEEEEGPNIIIQKNQPIRISPSKKGFVLPSRDLQPYVKSPFKHGRSRNGYASRTNVEDVTLPEEWSVSSDLSQKLRDRKEHLQQVCRKYGLDQRSVTAQPNAWEFLLNAEHNLAWCPIFKSASSTWMFNFNLLAGYSENFLLSAKDTPIALARKKYTRPTVDELDVALSANQKPLTFMIARHPLERLVSGYRDKLQGANRYYKNLAKRIVTEYRAMRPDDPLRDVELETDPLLRARMRMRLARQLIPTFPQFVQFLIDSVGRGDPIDEHWQAMHTFCTPCLVDFDIFAKVESLTEDGNYIIFSSGIEHVIKPKRINRSKNAPTNSVAKSYLCQLSAQQRSGLVDVYKYDFEMFDYEYASYFNCTGVDTRPATGEMPKLPRFH